MAEGIGHYRFTHKEQFIIQTNSSNQGLSASLCWFNKSLFLQGDAKKVKMKHIHYGLHYERNTDLREPEFL